MRRFALSLVVANLALFAGDPASVAAVDLEYPEARRVSVTDDFHGTSVADPYRWLEDLESKEVQEWMDAQNALTRSYLDPIPGRDGLRARLHELLDNEVVGLPEEWGGRIFFTRSAGLENQPVWYVMDGETAEPRVLLDPNALREDGTGAVLLHGFSRDGSHMAYGVSWAGSDWVEIRIRDVASGRDLPETLVDTKRFAAPAWTLDGRGFFYTRQPAKGTVPEGAEHYFSKIYYHELGTPQEDDVLVYERPDHREAMFEAHVTEDGTRLVVEVSWGSSRKNEIAAASLDGAEPGPFRPVVTGFDARYQYCGSRDGRILLRTNLDAPLYRLVAVDLDRPDREAWTTVIPERGDLLARVLHAGTGLLVLTLHNAHSRLHVHDLDGTRRHAVSLPGIGTVAGLSGRPGSPHSFAGFESFTRPKIILRVDPETGSTSTFHKTDCAFDPERFTTRQVWYESRDGTKVSMFLVHPKGLVLDGNNPVLLFGYGGFNVSERPRFSASRILWMERGGIYALPNLRGGGEYGEEWHEAGMLEKKQNVFDDFIAAGEYLIDHGYCRSERLAIEGGSNGGLLTAACMVQRPDLFGAVLVRVPVIDMLRYHRFTVARFWVPEYGSAEDPEQFAFLHAYSPLHNLRAGEAYPPTLITTGDTDDRVHPGQALKFAAALQAANASDDPILLRIDRRAGHGGGKPLSKRVEEAVDVLSFLFEEMGLTGAAN